MAALTCANAKPQWPSSCSATDSQSVAPGIERLATFGDVGARLFIVLMMFWVGMTMSAALGDVGSMQTETVSGPPAPL